MSLKGRTFNSSIKKGNYHITQNVKDNYILTLTMTHPTPTMIVKKLPELRASANDQDLRLSVLVPGPVPSCWG
jgi:hypothetical protein